MVRVPSVPETTNVPLPTVAEEEAVTVSVLLPVPVMVEGENAQVRPEAETEAQERVTVPLYPSVPLCVTVYEAALPDWNSLAFTGTTERLNPADAADAYKSGNVRSAA